MPACMYAGWGPAEYCGVVVENLDHFIIAMILISLLTMVPHIISRLITKDVIALTLETVKTQSGSYQSWCEERSFGRAFEY